MNEQPHKNENHTPRKKVLFLCTGNSCRSQMAEAWVNNLRHEEWRAYSAGIETHGMNKSAMKVMSESGVDMSSQHSKHVNEVSDEDFDLIITVCDHAAEHCPAIDKHASHNNTRVVHVPFDDPPKLALQTPKDEDSLESYRKVRDQIKSYIESSDFSHALA